MNYRLKVDGQVLAEQEHDTPGSGVAWAYQAMLDAGHDKGTVEVKDGAKWVKVADLSKPDETPPEPVAAPWNPDTV